MIDVTSFLNSRPANYARKNYDLFLSEIEPIKFKKSIHIAGTNGKGSTAMFLFEMFRAAGYKTALYISPHFKVHNELARVNDQYIPDSFIKEVIVKHLTAIEKYQLSFFEVMTFVSFKYFESEDVDVAIIEAGLGGLIDATNIFTPTISVITNIHKDHIVEIGPDISDIARHKAGIIKPGVPVVIGVRNEELIKIIERVAGEKKSPIITKTKAVGQIFKDVDSMTFVWQEKTYELNSGAVYETSNAAMALETIMYLTANNIIPIGNKEIKKGLKNAKMPARYTIVSKKPLVIVDGAHNMHGIRALIASVKALGHKQIKVVYAAFYEKEILRILDFFKTEELDVTLTTFEHERASKSFPIAKFPFEQDYKEAIAKAIKENEKSVVVICGSLYFASLVLEDY
ncbi:MAG TPA: Mur ligase family protein [Bacilli bacterium]|nr:Mur ligase family protein [Bacilli bacterium]